MDDLVMESPEAAKLLQDGELHSAHALKNRAGPFFRQGVFCFNETPELRKMKEIPADPKEPPDDPTR
jgi:hypothetical protein